MHIHNMILFYGRIKDTDRNRLVCVVLGPTAKVLVYDLAQARIIRHGIWGIISKD